jgi:hypothetical protein
MGSVLKKNGVDLWAKDVSDIYAVLVSHPDFIGVISMPAEAPEILDELQIIGSLTIPFYNDILEFLRDHSEFKNINGCLLFPYDWRQNYDFILEQLRLKLQSQYDIKYDDSGRAIFQGKYNFCLVGHSMGGVIAF